MPYQSARRLIRPSQLAVAVQEIVQTPARWRGLVRYDQQHRWYLRLTRDDEHEIWLLSWLPGQRTGFHDHGKAAGAFAVAVGALSERAALAGRPGSDSLTLPRGTVRSFSAGYVHDVANISAHPAVSVHAYSPPLTSIRRYEIGRGGLLRVTQEDRSW